MEQREYLCFVMMPIKSGAERTYWLGILDNVIRPAVEGHPDYRIRVVRVDEVPHTGNWLKAIVQHTEEADLVIADLSDETNPNVSWELGLRHARAPQGTIIIADSLRKVPSDLRQYNVFEYDPTGNDNKDFEARIRACISAILSGTAKTDSPFFDFVDPASVAGREIRLGWTKSGEKIEGTTLSLVVPAPRTPLNMDADKFIARFSIKPDEMHLYSSGMAIRHNEKVSGMAESFLDEYEKYSQW